MEIILSIQAITLLYVAIIVIREWRKLNKMKREVRNS